MEIKTTSSNKAMIVSVIGSIDALTSEQVTEALEMQMESGEKYIILDLGQVEFMSSAGLRVILGALKQARQQGGNLCLAAAQSGVERVLKMSGFVNILESYAGVDEAIAGFDNDN